MLDNIIRKLLDKSLKEGAKAVDVIAIDSTSLAAEVRLEKVVNIERSKNLSLALRILIDGKQAIVSTEDLSSESLDALVERGIAMAKVTPSNPYLFLATQDQIVDKILDLSLYDHHEPSAENLIEKAKTAEASALANNEITNSEGASSAYQSSNIYFATSNDFYHHYQTSFSSVGASVLAGKDEHMQTGSDYSIARFTKDLKSAEEIGAKAAQRAIKKLYPRKINTAQMPVIFDKKVARRILSAFASGINGQAISRGTSFLRDHLGKEIFSSSINIIDDPFIIKGLGSRPFDAEAILGSKLKIVENGVLNHYLLDLQTASKLKMQTTGHAARSLSSAPSPSSSNMYIENGEVSLKDMIKGINKGILVTEIFGHGANIITGDYSQGIVGFYIENGEVAYPVAEMTIASNLRDMFKNIIAANDLKLEMSINSPSLLIENMTVAGV